MDRSEATDTHAALVCEAAAFRRPWSVRTRRPQACALALAKAWAGREGEPTQEGTSVLEAWDVTETCRHEAHEAAALIKLRLRGASTLRRPRALSFRNRPRPVETPGTLSPGPLESL